jgi:hypothetical protein
MNKSKLYTIIIIVCVFAILSCNRKSNLSGRDHNETMVTGQKDNYFIRCKLLGIDNLRTDKKLLQIRIWISFSLYDTGKIVNIKHDTGSWRAEFYQYRFGLSNNDKILLISKNKVEGTPLSGWDVFLNKIEKFGIYTLNDNDRRQNSGLCTDANSISVEIIMDNKYYEYEYPCWEVIEDQSQIDKVKMILREIEKEYKFKVFPLDFESENDIKGFIN